MNRIFAYTVAAASRPWALAAALVLLTAALYLPWLDYTLLVHEETRRAVIARTMMESGEYWIPYLAERIYLAKPPIFNWTIAAASWPAGAVTEFTARLPSVIALALLALLMVFTAGQRLTVPARWLLGLSVLLTGELMHKAVLAEIELVFTLLVTASVWLWYELDARGRRGLALWLLPGIVVASAFLTKREPALVFYYLGIGAYLLTQRRLRELFAPGHLAAAAVTALLSASWLAVIAARTSPERVLTNMQDEVLTRGLSPSLGDYLVHMASYPVETLGAMLPFSVLLLPLAWRSVRTAMLARHGRMFVFCAVVVLANFPIYWLRADAAVRYFLPMFPTMLVIAAMVFEVLTERRAAVAAGARHTFVGAGGVLLAMTALLAAAAVVLSIPNLVPEITGPLIPAPLMGALGVAALAGCCWLLARKRREAAVFVFAATVGFGVMFRLAELGFVVPLDAQEIAQREDIPALLEQIRSELPAGVAQVQARGKMPHSFWFYDREGTLVPEARLERTGRAASDYVLIWPARGLRRDQLEGGLKLVRRVAYADGDLLLLRRRGGR